jgi:hypothetical protein
LAGYNSSKQNGSALHVFVEKPKRNSVKTADAKASVRTDRMRDDATREASDVPDASTRE